MNQSSNAIAFEQKYKELLDRKDKNSILIKIKNDLLEHYYNISIIELEILSNNIYDFCCLMSHNVSNDEICQYITYKNNCYYSTLSEENKKNLVTKDFKTLQNFTKKYINLLEN